MLWSLLCPLWISQPFVFENWNLQPELEIRALERFEENAEVSRIELGAELQLLYEKDLWRAGFGLRGQDSSSDSVGRLSLATGEDSNELQLSLAFLETHTSNENFRFRAGIFENSIPWSPLLWDQRRRWEGFEQSLRWTEGAAQIQVWALQALLAPQETELSLNQSRLRSWTFAGGVEWTQNLGDFSELLFRGLAQWHSDSASDLADASGNRGNSIRVLEDAPSSFVEDFAPVEVSAEFRSTPYGILARLRASGLLNPRSSSRDRGFLMETELGRAWTRNNLLIYLGLFSMESDLQIAQFVDRDWGGTNRRGVKAQLAYFPLDDWMLQLGYLWARTIRDSSFQEKRQEWLLSAEYRF